MQVREQDTPINEIGRCPFCGARPIDPHRWTCPLSDEDVEEWAEDDIDERDEEDDVEWEEDEEDAKGA